MTDSGVTSSSTRKQLAVMIATFKGEEPSTESKSTVRLVVRPMKEKSVPSTSVEDLKPLLDDFLRQHGWMVAKTKTMWLLKAWRLLVFLTSMANLTQRMIRR
jgi:hypothetical protein